MHSLETIEFYTQYHSRWFESVHHYFPSNDYIDIIDRILPKSWKIERTGLWYSVSHTNTVLPDQGWKLHISTTTKNSVTVLTRVLPILRDEKAPFKCLIDSSVTSLTNGKLWPRGSSGKFITIYPLCSKQFFLLGSYLCRALQSFVGPYILSDRRWPGSKSVYYRYGGFIARPILRVDGKRDHTIQSPEGNSVIDVRTPYWNPPSWVSDPFPNTYQTNHADKTLGSGRFSITSALSFSNRGGVYKGIDKQSGWDVILKEARPNIELGTNQLEAIQVLKKEYRLLTQLTSTGYYVQPLEFLSAWEHAFLVEKFEPGELLGQYIIRRNPLYSGEISSASFEKYFQLMQSLWLQLAKAIKSAHELNILLCDLSFTNVIVNDGRIRIFDLETSIEEGIDSQVGLYTPGMATQGISGRANDYFGLGAIIFGSIFLGHGMVDLYPPSLNRFLAEFKADIGIPLQLIDLVHNLMMKPEQYVKSPQYLIDMIAQIPFGEDAISNCSVNRLSKNIKLRFTKQRLNENKRKIIKVVKGVVEYLNYNATIERSDRLFPPDPLVFETNPLSVAYGATGVIYALHQITGTVRQDLIEWVFRHQITHEEYPPGLFLGQSGIAWVLSEIGYIDRAVEIMRAVRRHPNLTDSPNLIHGAAGYGLTCLKLWNNGAGYEFLNEAFKIGEYLCEISTHDSYGICWPDNGGKINIGYAHGGSGIALFLLYLSLAKNHQQILEQGRLALDFELHHGIWIDNKFAGFPASISHPIKADTQPKVLNCYWEFGSAGIGTAVTRFAAVTSDKKLMNWVNHLAADASRKYTVFPQLFRGLAGLGNFLLDAWDLTENNQHLMAAWEVAEGILLFSIDRKEGVAFPGEQTRRETADLATGSAGVALFLDRLLKASEGIHQKNFLFLVDELLNKTSNDNAFYAS